MRSGSNDKAITYEELTPGYEFPPASYELNASLISKYLEAVDSKGGVLNQVQDVPPLAIAAYAMTAMSRSLFLPPGTIHASQELEFFRLVPVGTKVNCQAKVARRLTRGQMRMLVLEFNVWDESGEIVQTGKATVMLSA